jgi:hypothetical protein
MRVLVAILGLLVASCAVRSELAMAPTITRWILPLSALDQEQVCVITLDYPGRRCTTVAEIRSFVRSVKAD